MQHWLPYDEQRLYSLLGARPRHDLAPAARRHAQPRAARRRSAAGSRARSRASSWRRGAGSCATPARLALLEKRALRTLTQGHLSQHLFFHSLHQEAIPTHATAIFGVASRAEWSTLRRSELSPLQICRLNGLPRGHAQEQAAATLREYAAKGVARQAIPAAQAERLLSRQLRQLPRWLQQTRYNGPPPLHSPRSSPATASNYSNNAALSGDGREVVFESYQAKLAIAKRLRRDRGDGAARVGAARPGAGERRDGRPALELQPRAVGRRALGRVRVRARQPQLRQALRAHGGPRPRPAQRPHDPRSATRPSSTISRSAYNPTISGDGRLIAYEAYDRPDEPGGRTRVVVRDLRSGRERAVPAPPGMATSSTSRGSRPTAAGSPSARSRAAAASARRCSSATCAAAARAGCRRRARRRGSRCSPRAATVVAYTAAGAGGESHVVVRDLARGARWRRSRRRPARASPSSRRCRASGRRVAFVARPGGTRQTQVFVRDLRRAPHAAGLARRRRDGPPGMGSAGHPAISGDGRRVAFTSDAWNLTPQKCNSARGVFVRDLARATTRPASAATAGTATSARPRGRARAERRVHHPPLRVTAIPHDPG